MSLRWITHLIHSNKHSQNLPGLVESETYDVLQIKRNRIWLITYIALFTSLLAFFILLISLVELEGSTPKRNYQKLVNKIYQEVTYQVHKQGIDWLNIENTLTKGVRLTLPADLVDNASLFSSARAKINPKFLPYLQSLAEVLIGLDIQGFKQRHAKLINGIESTGLNVSFMIRIEGHTDSYAMASNAKFKNNVELSTYRAYAMMEWIRIHTSLPKKQFSISGYGDFHPLLSDTQNSENRRIEIYLIPLVRESLPQKGAQ